MCSRGNGAHIWHTGGIRLAGWVDGVGKDTIVANNSPAFFVCNFMSVLPVKLFEALAQQIEFEFSASHVYLQASIFFAGQNMSGLAAHYRKDADSERDHGISILEFVLKRGGGALVLDAIPKRT